MADREPKNLSKYGFRGHSLSTPRGRSTLMSILRLWNGSDCGMPQKELIVPGALLCVIAIFTAFATNAASRPPLIGAFAQYLLPAILTIYLLAVLANARVIVELLAAFLLGNRKQQGSGGKSFAVILGYAIGIVLFLVFLRSVMFQSVVGVFQTIANLTGIWFHGTQSPTVAKLSGPSANPFVIYYTLIIFGATVVVAFALFFGGIHKAYEWARDEHTPYDQEAAKRDALGVVQKTVTTLKLNGDYREAILICYRQMCQVLSNYGFNIGLQETAREFSEDISHKLELGSDAIRGLTFLFEEARYSDHQIDDTKREVALNQLETLEHSLAKVNG